MPSAADQSSPDTPAPRPERLRWFLVVAWAAVIFGMSSIPGSSVPGRWSVQAHLVEYLVLGALAALALSRSPTLTRSAVWAGLLCSAYGASDEFHQAFVPGRTPDVADWAVDTVGAAIGLAIVVAAVRRKRPSPPAGGPRSLRADRGH